MCYELALNTFPCRKSIAITIDTNQDFKTALKEIMLKKTCKVSVKIDEKALVGFRVNIQVGMVTFY